MYRFRSTSRAVHVHEAATCCYYYIAVRPSSSRLNLPDYTYFSRGPGHFHLPAGMAALQNGRNIVLQQCSRILRA